MSGINLASIFSKNLLGATFAQTHPNKGGAPFTPPADFKAVDFKFTASQTGFAAQAYVNVKTGELVIAYRGSDNPAEATLAAAWASTGSWNAQFTDATHYAAAAKAAALVKVNEYRIKPENGLQALTQLPDDKILVTGHSLGGLLGQVVSKMFGWSGHFKSGLLALWVLVVSTAAQAQDPGKHALDYTYAEGSPQYWRGMHSSRRRCLILVRWAGRRRPRGHTVLSTAGLVGSVERNYNKNN